MVEKFIPTYNCNPVISPHKNLCKFPVSNPTKIITGSYKCGGGGVTLAAQLSQVKCQKTQIRSQLGSSFALATLQCLFLRHSFGMQKIVSFKQVKHCQLPDWQYLASELKEVSSPWLLLNIELRSISWLCFMVISCSQPCNTSFRTSASLASRS